MVYIALIAKILEAVTLPPLYVNHRLDLLCALVSISKEIAICSVTIISVSSQAAKSSV